MEDLYMDIFENLDLESKARFDALTSIYLIDATHTPQVRIETVYQYMIDLQPPDS